MVTESFLPQVNGVTNSVLRMCEHLATEQHEVLVIAPGDGPTAYAGATVVRTPSLPTPRYKDFRLACPWPGLSTTLRGFRPDVVHLASPAVLGAHAAFAAHRLALPIVAVYQTDLAGFVGRYGMMRAEPLVWRWLRRVHGMAQRNLAPSRRAVDDLVRNGVDHVMRWARGVDLTRFNPAHRSQDVRAQLAPEGQRIVGFVGRLAHEKQVDLLHELDREPGVTLAIVGDGPQRAHLREVLPHARFLGFRSGADLSQILASFDVFVHPGGHETFCQAAQEALASGVPLVAPDAGGVTELVDPGVNGAVFRPDSAHSLRKVVLDVLADDAARGRMACNARRSVAGRGWDVIGRELVDHYRAVVA